MKYITIKLTEDQTQTLISLVADERHELQGEPSHPFMTRLLKKLVEALAQAKS